MPTKLIKRLVQGRIKPPSVVRELLQSQRPRPTYKYQTRRRRPAKFIKGVSNGYYFRFKVPPKKQPLPDIPKLPPTNPMPKPFKAPPPDVLKAAVEEAASLGYSKSLYKWLRSNFPIMIINFGSLCTLLGFTRSDVLELRSLAITGNIMFIFYNLAQKTILWPPVAWSSLFTVVNGLKIFEILNERNAKVYMTAEKEKVFEDHFMPHGITPKQFERIERKAKGFKLKKGDFLIRKGYKLDHLYLVIEGSTRAHLLGRQITAASTNPYTKGHRKQGGDSGAWVGEMGFLNSFWEKEQLKLKRKTEDSGEDVTKGITKGIAIYTIVADEDCTVMSWSHDDMAELMESSNDMRSALTRAMTSALVGKVVNLSVSRTSTGLPRLTDWLSDWKNSYGASVQVQNKVKRLVEDSGVGSDTPKPAPA